MQSGLDLGWILFVEICFSRLAHVVRLLLGRLCFVLTVAGAFSIMLLTQQQTCFHPLVALQCVTEPTKCEGLSQVHDNHHLMKCASVQVGAWW
jgi:hypothetical protein